MEFQAKVTPPARVVGRIIRAARERKGYAAPNVAEWVGIDPDTYNRFEEGAAELPGEILDHLKVLLGVNPTQEWYHRATEGRQVGTQSGPTGEGAAQEASSSGGEVTEDSVLLEVQGILGKLLERIDHLRQENERLKALLVQHVMVDESPREQQEDETDG